MKANIHPKYYSDAQVSCVCGNKFLTGSTKKIIQTDICNACHPFFTGEMRFVDTQGRVDKFQQKINAAKGDYVSKKQRRLAKTNQQDNSQPLSLKDMIKATPIVKADKVEKTETKK